MRRVVRLQVNGRVHELYLPVHKTLLEVLREELGLTGTKHGCELGECGACTVLVGGKPVLACLTLAVRVEGVPITTIEGLGSPARPHPLQQAFAQLGALQCGYCTPGMILAARALLDQNPRPEPEEIRQALAGHLCRCTGYWRIVEAVQQAAAQLAGAGPS